MQRQLDGPIRNSSLFDEDDEGLDLRAYWRILVRGLWIVGLAMITAGAAAFFISEAATPEYSSAAKILVQGGQAPGVPSSNDVQASQQLAQIYVELIKTRPVLLQVMEAIGSPTDIADKISVRSPRSLIEITATDVDPERAALIANTTARVFVEDFQRRQLTRIAQFQASLSQFGISEDPSIVAAQAATITTLIIAEEAIPSANPVSPRTALKVILSALVGLLAGGMILVVREYADDRVRTPDNLRTLAGNTNLSAMGSVLRYRSKSSGEPLLLGGQPARSLIEAYKFLQTNLEFAAVGTHGLAKLLVTSSGPGEGKTTTAVNLAASIARENKTVLLVDTDMRRPDLHRLFNLDRQKGLTNLLLSNATIEEVISPTEVPGLQVLPVGPLPPDPPQLLRSSRMREVITQLGERADIVIFDSPPLQAVTDAMLLTPLVDGVLLVVDAGHTRRGMVRQSIDMLQQANAKMMGAVLNKISPRGPGGYGSYYYYYNYAVDSSDGTDKRFLARAFSKLRNPVSRLRNRKSAARE